MKVLILIIANNNNKLYSKLIDIHLSIIKNINLDWLDIYLVFNKKECETISVVDNIINFPFEEKPGYNIFLKSIEAIKLLDKNNIYDFVIRTNLSTFFNFGHLKNFLNTHIGTNNILSPINMFYSVTNNKSKIKCFDDFNLEFPVGFCIIIPKSLKNRILGGSTMFKEELLNFPDDVIFGYIFKKLDIKIQNIRPHLLLSNNYKKENINNRKFIFRNRTFIFNGKIQNFEKRYEIEINIWKELLKYFYNIDI